MKYIEDNSKNEGKNPPQIIEDIIKKQRENIERLRATSRRLNECTARLNAYAEESLTHSRRAAQRIAELAADLGIKPEPRAYRRLTLTIEEGIN